MENLYSLAWGKDLRYGKVRLGIWEVFAYWGYQAWRRKALNDKTMNILLSVFGATGRSILLTSITVVSLEASWTETLPCMMVTWVLATFTFVLAVQAKVPYKDKNNLI